MEKKVTKKVVVKKKAAIVGDSEPKVTASAVEPTPVKQRAIKVIKGEAALKKAVRKVVAKPAGVEPSIDPFAEIAATSPVKKPRKSPVTAKAPKTEIEAPAETVQPIKETATAKVVATKAAAKKPAKKAVRSKKIDLDVTAELAATEPEVDVSPTFKALADVSLPELKKDNRARLLMQSPTKAYFYWSVRENPWQQLRSVFGESQGSYTLVLKLTNLSTGTESFYPAEAEGSWWFDVEPDTKYEAEIGFYAPNRPYFRIVYSNTIETPRRTPSPHPASDARWTVSANKFAEVLDVSGFSRDAFDVAMAGDDVHAAADATQLAFSSFMGGGEFTSLQPEDIRYAMLSIAAGVTLDDLRSRVSNSLFSVLQASKEKLAASSAKSALKQYFDIDDAEFTEEEFAPAVYGASLVHFPKTLKTRKVSSTFTPRHSPLSSHSLR